MISSIITYETLSQLGTMVLGNRTNTDLAMGDWNSGSVPRWRWLGLQVLTHYMIFFSFALLSISLCLRQLGEWAAWALGWMRTGINTQPLQGSEKHPAFWSEDLCKVTIAKAQLQHPSGDVRITTFWLCRAFSRSVTKQNCKSQLHCPPVYFRFSTHDNSPATISFNYHGETFYKEQHVSWGLVNMFIQLQGMQLSEARALTESPNAL